MDAAREIHAMYLAMCEGCTRAGPSPPPHAAKCIERLDELIVEATSGLASGTADPRATVSSGGAGSGGGGAHRYVATPTTRQRPARGHRRSVDGEFASFGGYMKRECR